MSDKPISKEETRTDSERGDGSPRPDNCEITALELVALRLYANSVEGKPQHAKALELLENGKRLWREKFNKKKCPHCGK